MGPSTAPSIHETHDVFDLPTNLLLCAEDAELAIRPFEDRLVRWTRCIGAPAGLLALERNQDAAIIATRQLDDWALQWCRSARSMLGERAPPLFIWTQGRSDHRAAIEAGATDLVDGPILSRSDVVRLWAHLRRQEAPPNPGSVLRFGGLTLDLDSVKVRRNGRTIALSALQRRLLQIMLERPHHVFTQAELEEQLWGGRPIDGANLRTCMRRLRHALNAQGEVELVRNVRQAGYVLAGE